MISALYLSLDLGTMLVEYDIGSNASPRLTGYRIAGCSGSKRRYWQGRHSHQCECINQISGMYSVVHTEGIGIEMPGGHLPALIHQQKSIDWTNVLHVLALLLSNGGSFDPSHIRPESLRCGLLDNKTNSARGCALRSTIFGHCIWPNTHIIFEA